jgi:hypothetical protein
MKTPVIPPGRANARSMRLRAIRAYRLGLDCFVAYIVRNDCGRVHDAGGEGECDGNGGGDVIGRGGSRQAPALRPAIIQ